MLQLQLILDRQHTDNIADELKPVTKIQTCDCLHNSTLQYITIK